MNAKTGVLTTPRATGSFAKGAGIFAKGAGIFASAYEADGKPIRAAAVWKLIGVEDDDALPSAPSAVVRVGLTPRERTKARSPTRLRV